MDTMLLARKTRFAYKNTIYKCKNLLDRLTDRANDVVVIVVSVKVYPVRYVNTTDLPYAETWNCYKITRSCDLANCV